METGGYFQNSVTRSRRYIHTASVFARTSGLPYLQEVGDLRALSPHTAVRGELDSYLCFVVEDGEGTIRYGGEEYRLVQGDAVFLKVRDGYAQQSSDHRGADGAYDRLWALHWLHFNAASMAAIYEKYRQRGGKPVLHLGAERAAVYSEWIARIYETAITDSYTKDMELATQLTQLLTLLIADAWSGGGRESAHPGVKQAELGDIKRYLDEHYTESVSLEQVAAHFYINKQYLAKIFKASYGMSLGSYVQYLRVGKAKELLRFSDASVEQIGASIGIADPNYFARIFRKVEGVSPRQYRDSW